MDQNDAFLPPEPPRGGRQPVDPIKVIVNDTTRGAGSQRRKGRAARSNFSPWRTFQTVAGVALLVATLFTLWTPANLFSNNLLDNMFKAVKPAAGQPVVAATATASPRPRIGIVSGHYGNDSGSVCPDGLTEMEVNLKIATLVQQLLDKEGYTVDLLKEFDPRLSDYRALALVSIHNDSCDYVNDQATGFKVAGASSNFYPEKAARLEACLTDRYQKITGMTFHANSVTRDMTQYHAFSEINKDTTAAIIETGFLNLDREMLTRQTDRVAEGVASGILCYVRNENIPSSSTTGSTLTAPLETPAATPAP